jgi:hypothetical protein
MTISVKNLPEMLDDPNSSDMLRFVVSADAKRFILRLKQQTQISDDEVLALAVIAGEAALAKYADPDRGESCDQALRDIFAILDHDAIVLAMRRKVRELLENGPPLQESISGY